MQRLFGWLAVAGLLLAGQAVDNRAVSTAVAAEADSAGSAAAVKSIPLTPKNTKIQFVGTHSPPREPEPRTGSFEKFSGKAEVDVAGKALKKVAVTIETGSLKTEFDKLTNHLNSPDFFDTREYPHSQVREHGDHRRGKRPTDDHRQSDAAENDQENLFPSDGHRRRLGADVERQIQDRSYGLRDRRGSKRGGTARLPHDRDRQAGEGRVIWLGGKSARRP